jgi:hypothetical protein
MLTADEVMDAYIAIWSAGDEAERTRVANHALTDDATILYPSIEARGRDRIVAATGGLQERFPSARFVAISGVEQHHGWLRAAWRMFQGDGTVLFDGVDIGETAEDGRLRRVIGFHDPLPPA